MSADLAILEKALGHNFHDRELLERALTHKSKVYEKSAEGHTAADNEQLEFLGDAILGFAVSESLVRRFPSFPEGRLSTSKDGPRGMRGSGGLATRSRRNPEWRAQEFQLFVICRGLAFRRLLVHLRLMREGAFQ